PKTQKHQKRLDPPCIAPRRATETPLVPVNVYRGHQPGSFRSEEIVHENESARPIMIFDGNCGFCGIWIDYWKRLTGDSILYEPYQEAADRFPRIPRENFQ